MRPWASTQQELVVGQTVTQQFFVFFYFLFCFTFLNISWIIVIVAVGKAAEQNETCVSQHTRQREFVRPNRKSATCKPEP